MQNITILIVDDHKLLRDTWNALLSSYPVFTVVGETGSGEEAVQLAGELKPDIVIMDINLQPGINGLQATEQIRQCSPNSRVLGVSMHAQPAYARKMLKMGAMGYLTKNSPSEEMIKAIMEIYQVRRYICHEIRDILSEQQMGGGDDANIAINSLTKKEMEVIELVRKGHSSREIGGLLNISVKTAEVHRHNILKKLNLKNTASLINHINSYSVALDM
jgi:DNA-binding NarL/FixJ family response regulator